MTNTPSDLGNTCCNYFGKSQYNDPYFDGLLDNVSMWSTPLTQVQIQNFINTNPIGNESNLEGFWDFNEGAGSIANDQSVNSNNGQLTNINEPSAWVNIDSESLIPTVSILGQTASVLDLQNNKFNCPIMVGTNRRFYSIFHKAIEFLSDKNKSINTIKIDAPERFVNIKNPKFN